ncbi:hypothetical protein GCM10022284_63810 [Streptomyces hundungensis]
MRFAAWIFPVNVDGSLRQSWGQWTNWRTFVLLLFGPFLLIRAFDTRGPGIAWSERGVLGVAGTVLSTALVRAVIGYRQITSSARRRAKGLDVSAER